MEGVDYDEAFAPTVRSESVRALVALASSMGWVGLDVCGYSVSIS